MNPRVVPIRATELIRLRREHGWTQEDFAGKVGCDVRTVQRAEHNARAVVTTVAEFAQALGCEVADLLQLTPPAQQREQSDEECVVFPQNASLSPAGGYLGSWFGSGRNDSVESVCDWVPWEAAERPLIPVVQQRGDGVLHLAFDHQHRSDVSETWWAGVVYVGVGAGGRPTTIDITRFRSLCIAARAYVGIPGARMGRSIPLHVRLEDDSTDGMRGSCHQSSSWSKRPLRLTEYFHEHRRDLRRDFAWSKTAWYENSAAPNRRSIRQITVGQDESIENCRATIEIRRIRLTLD